MAAATYLYRLGLTPSGANPNALHYSASKAGLIGLTKSLGKERNPQYPGELRNPGAARTELFAQMQQSHIDYMLSKIPMNRFVEAHEIASLVCWLASDECSFSTGAVFDVFGGRATYRAFRPGSIPGGPRPN